MRILPLVVLTACTGSPELPPIVTDPAPAPLPADADVAGSYTLRFPAPQTQYLQVEAVFPGSGDTLDLMMPTWTPGSYKVRDYARHVEGLTATTTDGTPLDVRKTAPNRWQVDSRNVDDVVVRYDVYAHGLSVRENWVEPDFAMLNGAPTFIAPVDRLAGPFDVRIQRPDAWPDLHTALPAHPDGDDHRFRAPDFDVLVDSPIVLGDATATTWTVGEVPHTLVTLGQDGVWDDARSARDAEAISREIIAFWGGMPYPSYQFLNVVVSGRGGLEHKDSTLMLADRWATSNDEAYLDWLGLVSHEFFHTWNVKRLRPAALGPFDYERPVLTRSLWIAEGLTSYYDDLLLVRAGLMTQDQWLTKMSKNLREGFDPPGNGVRSLEDASEDAWIKYYQRDENHDNTSVDYYDKGAAVGFLLDARIRSATGGWSSLDDVMRLAYSRHSAEVGYSPEQFQALCEEVAGEPLQDFFDRHVRGTDTPDLTEALELYGLTRAPPGEEGPPPTLGATLEGGVVRSIRRDSPAWSADLIVGDEIVAIDGFRVHGDGGALIGQHEPGDTVTLTVSRRDRLRTTTVLLAPGPDPHRWDLLWRPDASIEAKANRNQLFGEPAGPAAASTKAPAPSAPAQP